MFTKQRPIFAIVAVVLAICAVIYLQRAHRDQSPSKSDRTAVLADEAVVDAQPTAVSSPVASIPTQAVEVSLPALNVPGTIPDTLPPPPPATTAVASTDPISLGQSKFVPAQSATPDLPTPPDTDAPSRDQSAPQIGIVPVVSQPQSIPEPREPPTDALTVPRIETPSVRPAIVPSPTGGSSGVTPAPELAKPESKTSSCPWTFQVAVVDGRTQLEAKIAGDLQFTVSCDHLEMKSPAGAVQAQGDVKVRGTNVEGTCKKLTLSWTDERVQLEGSVKFKCKQDGQDVDLTGEQLSIKLAVIETLPLPAPAE